MMKKVIILLISLLLIAGCTNSSIKKINDNPEKYLGKEVIIDGQINNRFMKSSEWYISVVDPESYILVQSKFDLEKKSNVTVTGILSYDKSVGYFIKSREVRVK